MDTEGQIIIDKKTKKIKKKRYNRNNRINREKL